MTGADGSVDELFDAAPSGLLVTDAHGRVVRANRAFRRLTGVADATGLLFRDVLSPASQLFYETRHLPVLRLSGRIDEVALKLRRPDGQEVPVLVTSALDAGGAVIRTTVFESSARTEFEQELMAARRVADARAAQLRILYEAEAVFSTSTSEHELAGHLADHARRSFASTEAAVFLDDGAGALVMRGGTNPLDIVPRPTGAGTAAMRSGLIAEVLADPPTARFEWIADSLRRARLESVTIVPLSDAVDGVGVLVLFHARRPDPDEAAGEVQRLLALQALQVLPRLRLQAQLERLALHDQLTDLPNRSAFHGELDRRRDAAETIAVVYFDLDGFKAVNDGLGHAAGDQVLRVVAERVSSVVRGSDAVARFGGDEFVVLCDDVSAEVALEVAERIREAVRQPIAGVALGVTASIGVVLADAAARRLFTPEQLVSRADAAMYRSKDGGRDRVTLDVLSPPALP